MFSYLINNVLSDTFRYIYRYLYFNVLVVPYQSNVKKTDIIKQATHVIFVSMYFKMFKNNRDFKTRWCFITRCLVLLFCKIGKYTERKGLGLGLGLGEGRDLCINVFCIKITKISKAHDALLSDML